MKRLIAVLVLLCLLCPTCLGVERQPPGISAVSAILMDADSGRVLYEKDAHQQRSIASITKLMTALVAVESTPELQTVIRVKPEHQAEGSSMYLKPGELLSLEELLYGLLLSSGNDAALAIADGCGGDVDTFVDWMNQWAAELGMEQSHFANPNGLDAEGHYSTAYDMALLARHVLAHEELAKIVATRSIALGERYLTNHNKLLWRYEGCMGMKTGYTDEAGRTLVSCAVRDGRTLICVTLHDPNDWTDHAALLDYGFSVWHGQPLARAGKVVKTLGVCGSLLPQVEVETAADVSYPLREGEEVQLRITLPDRVSAPVKRGEIAGKYEYLLNDEVIGETYLLYASDVPKLSCRPSFFGKLRDVLLRGGGDSSPAAFFL